MGFKTDTIAAISTAMTASGIGIVRISGEDAFSIIDKIYKGKKEKVLQEQISHTIHYGYIVDGEETIDEVLVLLMKGPRSYTGEDTVEIDCHGGVYVTKKILETVIKYGARPAEPGEFSKRAFLNGRTEHSKHGQRQIQGKHVPLILSLIHISRSEVYRTSDAGSGR